ncbi:unnamed protein product, partial [Closterium sp. Naga37s-1]
VHQGVDRQDARALPGAANDDHRALPGAGRHRLAAAALLLPLVAARLAWRDYFVRVVPTGVATSLDIALSNLSLALVTLTFYTMCKSSAGVFLLLFAFLFRLETPSFKLLGIILIISVGVLCIVACVWCSLPVAGETEFELVGFILVMLASFMAGLRWVLLQVLLQVEGAGEQRDMPAGVNNDDPAQAGVAAEPSTAEADGKSGARNQPCGGEKSDGGKRSSGSRSPDPRQQRDEGRGGGARSPDPRLNRDGGRGGGARSPDLRLNRDGGRGGGARLPDPRLHRDGGRGGGVRSPDPRQNRAEAATARQIRGSTGTVGAGAVRTRQIRGGITAEEAEGICAHQILITLVMRDAEVAIARLTCNGTVERSGEARRARLTGTCNMKKAGKADTVRSIGNRAGAGGTAVGLARLAGVGNTTEDVPVREDGINAAAEREAAG